MGMCGVGSDDCHEIWVDRRWGRWRKKRYMPSRGHEMGHNRKRSAKGRIMRERVVA